MRAYYEARAEEYDDWYRGTGLHAVKDRPGWDDELGRLSDSLRALPPARTLDVACGTGFLTRHLPGEIVGIDQSEAMLQVAQEQAPSASYVRGDALDLPFPDGSFERLFTAHFYGHLEEEERVRFLAEAARVADELVVVDSALRDGVEREGVQERTLKDGSRWTVFKRYFAPSDLVRELGGGSVVHAGQWFVAVRSTLDRDGA